MLALLPHHQWTDEEAVPADRLRSGIPLEIARKGFCVIELVAIAPPDGTVERQPNDGRVRSWAVGSVRREPRGGHVPPGTTVGSPVAVAAEPTRGEPRPSGGLPG